MFGKPKPAYLAKKEEARQAYLKTQAEHTATKERHGICRQRQDEASEKRRAESKKLRPIGEEQEEEDRILDHRELTLQRLERDVRKRFGEIPEPDERKDSFLPIMPRKAEATLAQPTARRPPPPPPSITRYGARQEEHEYVKEWLPRIVPGSWSEGSRRQPSNSTLNASTSDGSATAKSNTTTPGTTGSDPFADEYAVRMGFRTDVVRP